MAVGTPHARVNQATPERLAALQNSPSFRRMWARQFRVDVDHQVPDTSGVNVLGTVYYLDKDFYDAVRTGQVHVPGMTPKAIIQAALIHERTGKCILDADNDVDEFLGGDREAGAQEYATLAEHAFVRRFTTPRAYEAGLRAIQHHNEHKPITNPPPDLDCEPYVERQDAGDERALDELRQAGVEDATKKAKVAVRYGRSIGEDRCVRCANWLGEPTSELAPCRRVAGAVRSEFWCEEYAEAKKPAAAPRPDEEVPAGAEQAPTPDVQPRGVDQPTPALSPDVQALIAAHGQTNASIQQLAKALTERGTQASAPTEEAPQPAKKKSKRKIKMSRAEDGSMVAEVYEDGKRKRRVRAKRDEDGGLTAEEE